MSDYKRALEDRADTLRGAIEAAQQANDAFLDPSDGRMLENIVDDLDAILANTEEELDLVDTDWPFVEEKAHSIMLSATEVAKSLADTYLYEFDEERQTLIVQSEYEPQVLLELRKSLNRTLETWHDVRTDASDLADGGN